MNVLSLFDGISCGQIALNRAGVKYENYYASEIDRNAISVTQRNYPNTIQLGDVTTIDTKTLPKIDLLIGGSPCQGFSNAGLGANFNDPRSKLFWEYVRIMNELNTENKDLFILLENVPMKKQWESTINKALRCHPVRINSSSFSAQNRKRLYWTNIKVNEYNGKSQSLSEAFDIPNIVGCASRARYKVGTSGKTAQNIELRKDNKSNCMTTIAKNCMVFHEGKARHISRNEAEILQTIPKNYTSSVSESKAISLLGNGWTVDVIAHIFKSLA